MITRFHIQNFKSLADFDLPPAPHRLGSFTCLVGLNGSGKSTLLQALDFAAQLMTGNVREWLDSRGWKGAGLVSNFGKRSPVISLRIDFEDSAGSAVSWGARYNVNQARCTYETVEFARGLLLELAEGRYSLASREGVLKSDQKVEFVYQGSVLSVLQLKDAHPLVALVKESLAQLKSLELLSPQLMRRRAYAAEDIGLGGEKLSAFLSGLPAEKRTELRMRLQEFYPGFVDFHVRSLQAGWKDLSVVEAGGVGARVPAAHMNDGLLRILAILAQVYSSHTLLLFDEIENGINPELVKKLVEFLIGSGKQIIVTTHSPMILNYIPDEVAKTSVMFLYKDARGCSRAARFFDLPSTQGKLVALGPGEVFADTSLTDLAGELLHRANGS